MPDYAFLGMATAISHFAIPLNAQSTGHILLQMRDSNFDIKPNAPFTFDILTSYVDIGAPISAFTIIGIHNNIVNIIIYKCNLS